MLKDLHGRLRPLGIADILDETVELYKSNFVLLAGIVGVIYIPYTAVSGLIRGPQLAAGAIGSIVDGLAAVVISSIVTGALTFAISERYLDRPASVAGSYRRMLKASVFLPLLGAMILKDVIIFAPFGGIVVVSTALAAAAAIHAHALSPVVALLVVGASMLIGLVWAAYFGVRFALVEPTVILEQAGVGRALSRSWSLIGGSVGKGFWLLLVVVLVTSAVVFAFTGPTTVVMMMRTMARQEVSRSLLAIHTILTALVQMLVASWTSIAVILLYYDMRIRKEGFDLDLLARELDESARAFRAHGAAALPQEQPSARDD